jgi:hypothetical protein
MLTGCGYSSMQNETIGQVKKVVKNTPLICPDYVDADVSLGVMRNGVGSMSTEDLWFYVPDEQARQTLAQAAQTGALVKITYDVKRVTFCVSDHFVSKVELVK